MKAMVCDGFGGPEVLKLGERPDPVAGPGELLLRVRATALNRADLLQRRGQYPPPPGASDVLGLECAGVVEQVGAGVAGWQPGDRVCALLPGGGYAEKAAIPAGMAMRLPDGWSFAEGAAVPEAFLTAYLNLRWLGELKRGEHVLVHAGASGVGTAAIQLARAMGARASATAGSADKLEQCRRLGAVHVWNYKLGPFLGWARETAAPEGFDLILDFVGAPYLEANLATLGRDGRLVIIGTMGGGTFEGTFDVGAFLTKRLSMKATTLRSQPTETKMRLTGEFWSYARPLFERGELAPLIDRAFSWREAADAHRYMEQNRNIGKIVLLMDDESR